MSDNVVIARVQQYTTNVQLLLQQKGSKLRSTVNESSYTGKAAKSVEQIGSVNAQKVTSRHADTPLIATPHDARWCFPTDYIFADMIDDEDRLRMLISPDSEYALNGAYSMGRAMDDEIIDAFFGTSKTGENGSTSTSFPAANQIAVATGSSGATGMNVAKLRAAKKSLMAAEVDVDNDPLYVAITAEQHDDLLAETQAVSLDFTDRPALVDGKISAFMGFNFVHIERLEVNGSSQRRCPAWARSGMHLGLWNDISTSIDRRPDKSNATQIMVKMTVGACRVEENKVIEIICAE